MGILDRITISFAVKKSPYNNGQRLETMMKDTTTAAVASANSPLMLGNTVAMHAATNTAILRKVSAHTCWGVNELAIEYRGTEP